MTCPGGTAALLLKAQVLGSCNGSPRLQSNGPGTLRCRRLDAKIYSSTIMLYDNKPGIELGHLQ